MFVKTERVMAPAIISNTAPPAASMPSSAVYDIDATQAASYPGTGQELFNQIASPPVPGTYNFWNGTTSGVQSVQDLTFTGSAGSPAAYFNVQTGSTTRALYIQAADFAAQPDFILDFHKSTDGAKRWVGQAFRMAPTWNNTIAMFGNENNPANQGFAVYYIRTSETIRFQIGNGVSGVTFDWNCQLIADVDYLLLFSLSNSGGNTSITLYANGENLGTVVQAVSTTTDATGQMALMNDDSLSYHPTDARFYWAGMGNDELNADDEELIRETLESRHARPYSGAPQFAHGVETISGISPCWEFDPRVKYSYGPDSQTVHSLVYAPSIGVRGNYEFWRGADGTASATDMGFNGTAFTSDGGDCLSLKAVANTNIAKHHRSDQAGSWLAFIITTEASLAGAETWWAQTAGTTEGVRLILQTDERLDFTVGNGAASMTVADVSAILSSGTYLIVLTWNGTTTSNNVKVAINSASFSNFSGTFGASTIDSTAVLRFLSNSAGSGSFAGNGTQILWAAGGSDFLSDADLAAIIALLESTDRHNTNYA